MVSTVCDIGLGNEKGTSTDQLTILWAEDNDDDALLMQRALSKARILNPVQRVSDGREAIDYLSGKGRYSDRTAFPMPFMVLLDLKMPYLDGFDVLAWIRSQESLQHLNVVVLSSSDHDVDIKKAYAMGANSYLVKPSHFAEFVELFKTING